MERRVGTVATSPNHLQYLGPTVRAGHANRSCWGAAPATPTVIRIEVSARPPPLQLLPRPCPTPSPRQPLLPAVGFQSCRCYFGKVNFLSVKREIDMAASCFIS